MREEKLSLTNISSFLADFSNWHNKWKVLSDISEVDELSFVPWLKHRWLSPALPRLPGVLSGHHCSNCALPQRDFCPQHCSYSVHSRSQLYWEVLCFVLFSLNWVFFTSERVLAKKKKKRSFSILCFKFWSSG